MGQREKRRCARYPTNDGVSIAIDGVSGKHPATILNVSSSGLQLELGIYVPIETKVQIFTTGNVAISGEIRYCLPAGEVFRAGVRVQNTLLMPDSQHLDEDLLSHYLAGKGLAAPVVIRIQRHLETCAQCDALLTQISKGRGSKRLKRDKD